ncbi:hypothetical protein L0M95_18640, partial [Blautia obeum]
NKNSSNVECKYILYKLIGTNYVHLGIDISRKDGCIDFCYPKTFLVEKKMGKKFIENQTELVVKSIEVEDKSIIAKDIDDLVALD